jgi:hypothetical protein
MKMMSGCVEVSEGITKAIFKVCVWVLPPLEALTRAVIEKSLAVPVESRGEQAPCAVAEEYVHAACAEFAVKAATAAQSAKVERDKRPFMRILLRRADG